MTIINKNLKTDKKIDTDENVLYIMGWILIVFFLSAVILYFLAPTFLKRYFPPCMFLKLTGLYCPGCGGTRAVFALLRGKIVTSFIYHPFVLYTAFVGGWFMISQSIERISKGKLSIGMKYRDVYLWIALILVIVNFFLKNILLLRGIDVFNCL